MKTHAHQFPVQKMCSVLKVSVTGYYYWRRGIIGPREHMRNALVVGMKWVSDLTYIKTGEGWLYLTMVMDLADRKVTCWALSDTMKAGDTSVPALKMAVRNRPPQDTLLFHSDRGVQYACHEFRNELKALPILQSMSKKGCCWDNAVAESFFKTLKVEMIYHNAYKTRQKAELEVFEYIEVFYNRKRKHSYLGYKTPIQCEAMMQLASKAA